MKEKVYRSLKGVVFIAAFIAAAAVSLPAASVILNATGALSGKTQDWTNYGDIIADDAAYADTTANNAALYTLFETSTDLGVITDVRLHIKHFETGTLSGGDVIGSNVSHDQGTNWSNGVGGWAPANVSLDIGSALMSNSETNSGASIFPLFPSCSWADVNNIGAVFRTSSTNFTQAYANWAYLEVFYNTYTPTPTATETDTVTPTWTESPDYSATWTSTITETDTASPTGTDTDTPTETYTPTSTDTDTPDYSPTETPTITDTDTPLPTETDTDTITETYTDTPTFTATETGTDTGTPTETHTPSPTNTDSPLSTVTDTPTVTETHTDTATGTYTASPSDTATASPTSTDSPQDTSTNTPSVTKTFTATSSITPTVTPTITLTVTRTWTNSGTPTYTPSNTPTVTETGTITQTHTISPTFTDSPAGTLTFTPTPTSISAGEGTAIIAPTQVVAGSTGNTMVLTYTNGSNTWSMGTLKVIIPAGWSPPDINPLNPGYFTVLPGSGVIVSNGKSGQTIIITIDGLAPADTITVTYGSKTGGGPGAAVPAGAGTVQFSVEMNPAGSNTFPIASSPQVQVLAPTPTASVTKTHTASPTATMTFTQTPSVTPTNTPQTGEGICSVSPLSVMTGGTGNTLVFTYTAGPTTWAGSPGSGMLRITIPAGWSAPSTTSTAPGYFTASCQNGTISGMLAAGSDIVVTAYGLLANTGKITVTYGDRTGVPAGPGATAQPGAGTVEFTVRSIPSGASPNKIANSPQVNVAAATATATCTITPTYSATPDFTPGKPANFTVSQNGNSTTLGWITAPFTDTYKIYRATGASGRFMSFPAAWTLIATVLPTPVTTSYTDNNSLDYVYYLVTGKNGGGEGNPGPIGEKVNLNFIFTPGGLNTYRVSLPYVSLYAKASDLVLAVEGSLALAPSKIDKLALWNPANQNYIIFGWQAGVGAWIGTDWPVDSGTLSSNAVYAHVISNFTWPISGASKSQGLYFKYNASKANANERSLPYSSNYHKASDVVQDIEGGTGPGANLKINRVAVWNVASQSYTAFGYSAGSGWTLGADFNINPGEALNIFTSGNLLEFTWTPKISVTPVP